KHIDLIVPQLNAQELWCCDHFFEPEIVLNKIQPDVAIFCNVNTFRSLRRYASDIIQILDLCGPVHFEDFFIQSKNLEANFTNGPMLQGICERLVDRLREADYIITVSQRQKHFWAAYCSLAGFSFADLDPLVCPLS